MTFINMRSYFTLIALAATLVFASESRGAVIYNTTYSSGLANSGYVPDNNISGWSDSHAVSGLGTSGITGVSVGLNISGGWNGDLYGYLQYQPTGGGSATLLVLLDRVGDPSISGGYGDTGFAVTLSDAGAHPIENRTCSQHGASTLE